MAQRMSPEQYRDALKALEMSQIGFAKLIDVDARTSRRWASGDLAIPTPVAVLMAVMIEHGYSEHAIEQVLARWPFDAFGIHLAEAILYAIMWTKRITPQDALALLDRHFQVRPAQAA